MTVKLGTVAPIGFDDLPPNDWLPCLRRLGCQVVQAYRNQKANVSVARMLDAIAAGGMPCDSLHAVFGEEFDPSCPQESTRRFAVDTYKSEGELCRKLGGSLVVVHCSTIRPDGVPADERLGRVAQLKATVAELGSFGAQIGVQYAFENLPSYHPLGADVAELAGILDEVQAPNTGLCLDTGHANMTGSAAAAVAQGGKRILYVHVSDNSGQKDDHDMPTYGTMDTYAIARQLHLIGYEGTLMLEVFYSVRRLQELIDAGFAERLKKMIDLANGAAE